MRSDTEMNQEAAPRGGRNGGDGAPPSTAGGARGRAPFFRRTVLLAALLATTLGAGVAARLASRTPGVADPGDRGDPGVSTRGGGVQLGATLDRHSVLLGGDGTVRVELVIGGEPRPVAPAASGGSGVAARVPTDLVVILDRSGSMEGEPLRLAKAAVSELVSQLGAEDRFGLVTYATGGEIAIGLEPARDGARARWEAAVRAIRAGGGTQMSLGLDLAHRLVSDAHASGRATRVILLSDGHANQGDSSIEGLRARAARAVTGEYVLSAVGVGQGFDETVMSALSDAGTGNFYYLPDARRLAGVFSDEFAAARERVASGLEVRVQPGDGVQVVDAAGLPLETDAQGVRFRPGDLFAGQERRLWLTLRAPTRALGAFAPGRISLAFRDARGEPHTLGLDALPRITCVAAEDDYFAGFDADAYRRASAEAIGALEQRVAASLRAGRPAEARSRVDAYLGEMREEQTRVLGYVVKEDAGVVTRLRDAVSSPAAALPSVRNQLGKQLLQQGLDARRAGSKRKTVPSDTTQEGRSR